MGYNLACVRDICEIFAPMGGFRGWAIECCQLHFSSIDLHCHGNEIWDKLGDFCAYRGVFGDGPLNAANRIFAHQPPLPWQQNLGQNGYNLVCVRDICEIFASKGGFLGAMTSCLTHVVWFVQSHH